MVELLRTKLFIPQTRADLVPRPRLVERLNAGLDKKLTLVSAPAGFGKTTLAVAWLKQVNIPAAWLSVDEADNDLRHFLAYLVAALQQVDEEICAALLNALQSPQLPGIEKIMTGLLNEVAARTDRFILVLDDYHLISEAVVLQAIKFLIDYQPTQLHLVLTTREDPDLPLARLRARGQLTEIRAGDLRFTHAEADSFLRSVMGLSLSEQDVAALGDRTEGWAAGLQLAGLSLQKQADLKSFVSDFSGSHRHILDYLTDEVLQQQPEGIQSFLLQTSILDRFCGPLCDALTGRTESGRLLAHLEAANLFVVPLDEERRWYRYHHLFSSLLRSQLSRSQPELVPVLHRRASGWYELKGDVQAAVEHALQASDPELAARLIEQHAIPKLFQGQVFMVVGWFARLPQDVLGSAPMLCINKAWALVLMRHRTLQDEVELTLQAAEQALDHVKADQDLRNLVAGHAASIRSFSLRTSALMGGEPEKLIAMAQKALGLLPGAEKGIRSTAALSIGYGYQALSDLEAAGHAFRMALEDGLSGGNFFAAIYGSINLVFGELLLGHLKEAQRLCEQQIEQFNRVMAGQSFPPIGALYIYKGSLLLESDCLAEAEQAVTEGLDLIRWTGESIAPKTGYTSLARLCAIQGNRQGVLEAVRALEEAWPERTLYAQALCHCLSIRHWPDDLQVRMDALAWLSQSEIEFSQLAVINSVDPLQTTSLETHLNAAHVLAGLVRAKQGLYPVEAAQHYLKRQQDFAVSRGFVRWWVETALARTLLYQAAGMKTKALETLQEALSAAAPTGFYRIFLDECGSLEALLQEVYPRLIDPPVIAYVNRLLAACGREPVQAEIEKNPETHLSERELEVLQNLARGLSYEEIGRQLFLSLNTIQFHVKNIYRKLLVNKRVHAIEKAQELNLI